jgi:hypothetical protein
MDALITHFTQQVIPDPGNIIIILILVTSSIFFRVILEKLGQRWITTFSHTATITLLPIITYVITKVISGNIALSLGMVGALSIVRFRNPVRSPLELSVYFGAITMGIAASVALSWLFFFIEAILLSIGALILASYFSKKIFKKPFFYASFSEGNSLSTLEIDSLRSIDLIEKSEFLKSKTYKNEKFSYLLISKDLSDLKSVLSSIEKDPKVCSFQLSV